MNASNVAILVNGVVAKALLQIDDSTLVFKYRDTHIAIEDSILFVALTRLRKELEKEGILLAVEGCRRDVHPSGMQLDLNTGSAYILTLGQTGGKVVDIFEPSTLFELIASVEGQEEYYKKWIQSLKGE